MVKRVLNDLPGELPSFTMADAAAVKAWSQGTATEDQQKRAYSFVLYDLAGINRPSFNIIQPHVTSFREGRRSIAMDLVHLEVTPMDRLIPPKPRSA